MPILALAALGGAYSSSVLPLLAAAAVLFFAGGGAIASTRETRLLDVALVLLVVAMGLQILPLPWSFISSLSPRTFEVMASLTMLDPSAPGTLSIRPAVSRETLISALSVVLVFWGARGVFDNGGLRPAVRLLSWAGLVAALVGLAQRATSPMLLLWTWKPLDPGGRPFGPFVNRNHFAFWLLLAGAVAAGAAISHIHAHGLLRRRALRDRFVDLLADGTGVMLLGSAALMWLTLIASTSRGAILGMAVTCLIALVMAGRRIHSRAAFRTMIVLVVALLSWGVWANIQALASRLDLNSGDVPRVAVWTDTLPVISAFAVTGTGAGTFADAMVRFQQHERRVLFSEAQSEYLQLMAEGGLLLAVPVLVALLAWLRLSLMRLKASSPGSTWIRLGALAGLSGAAVQCLWDSALRMPANAMLVALLAAIAVHQRTDGAGSAEGNGRGPELH